MKRKPKLSPEAEEVLAPGAEFLDPPTPHSEPTKLRFDLVPQVFIERVAARFTEGAVYYSAYNYRYGCKNAEYIQDRINHMLNHLHDFLILGPDSKVDDLAAIAWCVAVLMEFEHTGGRDAIKAAIAKMNNRGIDTL